MHLTILEWIFIAFGAILFIGLMIDDIKRLCKYIIKEFKNG